MTEQESVGRNKNTVGEMQKENVEHWLDNNFEPVFFKLRHFLLIPVIVSFCGSILMFIVGSLNIAQAMNALILNWRVGGSKVILPIIKALDAFLIGIVLVIFSFGVYDFFVSELEPANYAGIRPDWFKFESTGELKNKLIEVVLVILSIKFFEQIVANIDAFQRPEMYLVIPTGAAILAISLGFFKWAIE